MNFVPGMNTFDPLLGSGLVASTAYGFALRQDDRVQIQVKIRGLRTKPGPLAIALLWPAADGQPQYVAIDANGDGDLAAEYAAAAHGPDQPGFAGAPKTVQPDPDAVLEAAKAQAAEDLRAATAQTILAELVDARIADQLAAIDAATSTDEIAAAAVAVSPISPALETKP